jgi:hypothetical protein
MMEGDHVAGDLVMGALRKECDAAKRNEERAKRDVERNKRAEMLAGMPKCPKCHSPLNKTKVQRRGNKCACGATVML